MNFEPQKFFIGLTDFFSILLPGALLAWLVKGWGDSLPLVNATTALEGPAGWAAFLFAAYILGNIVFLLGAMLDGPYDWLRKRTLDRQIKALAGSGKLLPWWQRLLTRVAFPGERNIALNRATQLRRASLRGVQAEEAINTYQWAKAWLRVESPASVAEVERFEAHSKFFRCLAMVLVVLIVTLLVQRPVNVAATAVVFALLLLSIWRFADQRYKATRQAYWSAIVVAACKGEPELDVPETQLREQHMAGAVVYRKAGDGLSVLLVDDAEGGAACSLPGAHVEAGESPAEAAVRAVYEQAGAWARVMQELGEHVLVAGGARQPGSVYLLEWVGYGLPRESTLKREWRWVPHKEAVVRAGAMRRLLEVALPR